MRRVTLEIDNGETADVPSNEGKAYACISDIMSKEALINIIRTSGYNTSILNDEYLRALAEQKGK